MSHPTILIVDDDYSIQSFVSMALTDEGFRVRTASNGGDALKILSQEQPDLILLDMRMPSMNGQDFTNAYHQMAGPHAPIVIMSAGRNLDGTVKELNVQGFLVKPFDLDDLLKLVEQQVHF